MPILGALGNGGAFLFGIGRIFGRGLVPITTIDYLIVGGGGGGGTGTPTFVGGGGGAGGLRQTTSYSVTPNETYFIAVGSGGATGANGSNSGIFNASISIWSTGGGLGASSPGSTPGTARGMSGGSGGGGGASGSW